MGSALALQQIFLDAGLPEHLVTTLVVAEIDVPEVIGRLIDDDRIAAVTLTGSNRAGAAVGSAAGRASKKSVLELGGSDAFVVLDDADVPGSRGSSESALSQCGPELRLLQTVRSPPRQWRSSLTDLFVKGARALVVGDPTDARTDLVPLARADLPDALQRQVDASLAGGAVLLAGGRAVDGGGFFYEPTVLSGTGSGVPVFDEETFGPVAAIAVAGSDAAAVELANATPFGPHSACGASDVARGVQVAKQITTGAVFINATASDARMPFGGTKKSGYGRELAAAGIREFTNIRTYWTVPATT